MHRLGRHLAALVAAAVGYYVGLVSAVAGLGLSGGAELAPLSSLTVGGLAVGVALGLFDGRRRLVTMVATGLGLGAALGVGCWSVEPDLEWCVGALALLSQTLAWWSGTQASS